MNPDSNNQQPGPAANQAAPSVGQTPQAAVAATPPPGQYGDYGPQPAVAATYQSAPPAPAQQAASPPPAAVPPPTPATQPVNHQPSAQQKAMSQKAANSTQNALQIAEIRDGLVIMEDGSFRSVIMAKSINFDLMSPQEREAVEGSYQGFLNSLYFPIQIFIHSQRVDIRPYLERLNKMREQQDNMLLAMLTEDYLGYISELASQTNIMDKKFYIVVPYFPTVNVQKALTQSKNFFSGLKGLFKPQEQHVTVNQQDLEKAKDELKKRVSSVLDGLRQCNIPALPLDTQELIELYYDTYNPDTATRQQLKNFEEVGAPVITKGQGQATPPNLQEATQ